MFSFANNFTIVEIKTKHMSWEVYFWKILSEISSVVCAPLVVD